MCFRNLNLAFKLEFDLFCYILAYNQSLLFIRHLISHVTQGWPSFGLQNFVGTYFSVILFRHVLNSDYLVSVSDAEKFSIRSFDTLPFVSKTSPVHLLVQFNRSKISRFFKDCSYTYGYSVTLWTYKSLNLKTCLVRMTVAQT